MLDALHKIPRISWGTHDVAGTQIAPRKLPFAEIVVVWVVESEPSRSEVRRIPLRMRDSANFSQVLAEFILGEVCRLHWLLSRLSFHGLVDLRAGAGRPQFSQDRQTSDKGYRHAVSTRISQSMCAKNDRESGATCVQVRGMPSLADYVAQQRLSPGTHLQDMHIRHSTAKFENVTSIQIGAGCLYVLGEVPFLSHQRTLGYGGIGVSQV
jgi:hypothetical protein